MRDSDGARPVLEAARASPAPPVAPMTGTTGDADDAGWGAEGFVQFPVFPRLELSKPVRLPEADGARAEWELAPGDVHLWRFDLDELWEEEAAELLARDELERARRYRFGLHRRRFITGRAVVRCILGGYLDRDPGRLAFEYGRQGKPALQNSTDLVFNLSHSGSVALLGVGRRAPLGVDVERLHAIPELEAITRQTFSEREAAAVLRASGQQRRVKFFQCWTRKEAFVKALGGGLSIPLKEFDVSLEPQPRLLAVRGHHLEPEKWTMRQVVPRDGFVASVACRSRSLVLRCFVWPPSRPVPGRPSGEALPGSRARPHAPSGNGGAPDDARRSRPTGPGAPGRDSRSSDSDHSGTRPDAHLRQEAR